jgi:hypothetical protein
MMSEGTKWAVLGTVATAVEDRRESVECIRAGFESEKDAIEFAKQCVATPARERRLVDVYWESYLGEHWRHQGGRCFYHARLTLKGNHVELKQLCADGPPPVVVIGECDLKGPDDTIIRGRHDWVEAGKFVIECGSYLRKLTYYEKPE